jgi:hypothetical protein
MHASQKKTVFSVGFARRSYLEDNRRYESVSSRYEIPTEVLSSRRSISGPVRTQRVIRRVYVCCSAVISGVGQL